MSFRANNGTALRDGNKACVSLHPTHPPPPPFQRTSCFLPSHDLSPAHSEHLLLFVIFYAVISISMKEHR